MDFLASVDAVTFRSDEIIKRRHEDFFDNDYDDGGGGVGDGDNDDDSAVCNIGVLSFFCIRFCTGMIMVGPC